MKYGWIALAMCGLFALPVHAENYGGLALGAAEFCEGAGESGFFGGDCLNPRFLLRGYAGHRFSDFVSLELSFDAILDPRGWFGGGHGNCLLYTSGRCRRYAVCRSRWSPYH